MNPYMRLVVIFGYCCCYKFDDHDFKYADGFPALKRESVVLTKKMLIMYIGLSNIGFVVDINSGCWFGAFFSIYRE